MYRPVSKRKVVQPIFSGVFVFAPLEAFIMTEQLLVWTDLWRLFLRYHLYPLFLTDPCLFDQADASKAGCWHSR